MTSTWPKAPSSFAEITTFRVGGPIADLTIARTEAELIAFAQAHPLDGPPVLFVAGGSNMLISDDGFAGPTCLVRTTGVEISAGGAVTAQAGVVWDDLVAQTVDAGLSGLEPLSGIPGSVGATPVQNVGAYGAEVADTFVSLRALDRVTGQIVTLTPGDLEFGYRTSVLKLTAAQHGQPGYLVLEVTFQLEAGGTSAPVRYGQLAAALGVELGQSVPPARVRQAVLDLRRSKGMVLDESDHDTWSAGSFFTNPILPAHPEPGQPAVPEKAPRYPVRSALTGEVDEKLVKTSAAWLIDHAGFSKGYRLDDSASLSTKHTLALTNRGSARTADIVKLAAHIQAGVKEAFGIELHPEPNLVGVRLN